MAKLFATEQFDRVIHWPPRAGVRYSLENPYAYADANLMGYLNILEGCRHTKVKHTGVRLLQLGLRPQP